MEKIPIDPNRFWNTEHLYNPSLTDQMVRDAERRFEKALPSELKELLRLQNGGYTIGFVFPMEVKTSWADDHVPFDELAGINLDPGPSSFMHLVDSDRIDSVELREMWRVPEKQILLAGDGHFFVTLDYRKGDQPSVAWIDNECDEDIKIAETFRSFLEGLVASSEFEFSDHL